VQAHIFEPFFTTKTEGHGTGLGLATVYGAVRQNHGCIRVRSEVGRGTTFEIEFPLEIPAGVAAPQPLVATGPQHGQETLLVVEDEIAVLRITERILRERGYRVLAARSGHAALALAAAHATELDLLILDIVMPDIRGHDLARQLAVVAPRARCLYISGYPADDVGRHGMRADGIHFLAKPFTASGLATRVREVLDGP
jgi:CheY-like chemotaxis protein